LRLPALDMWNELQMLDAQRAIEAIQLRGSSYICLGQDAQDIEVDLRLLQLA